MLVPRDFVVHWLQVPLRCVVEGARALQAKPKELTVPLEEEFPSLKRGVAPEVQKEEVPSLRERLGNCPFLVFQKVEALGGESREGHQNPKAVLLEVPSLEGQIQVVVWE